MRRALSLLAILVPVLAPLPGQAASTALQNCANARLGAAETVRFCEEALRERGLRPKVRAQVLVNIGVALADLGRHSDAVGRYGLAIRTDPGLMPAYTNRARSNAELGRGEDALADYAAAIAADPGFAEAWAGRGALLLRYDRAGEAEVDLSEAVRLAPDDMGARFNRGLARLGLGRAAEAEADFSTVLARDPDDAGAYLNRGRAREARGGDGAEQDMTRALTLAPEWGWGHFIRGQFLERQGRLEAANTDYQRAYQLGYSNTFLIDRIRRLSGD